MEFQGHWYEAVLKRNPIVSSRVCQAQLQQELVQWKKKYDIGSTTEVNNWLHILQDPPVS